MKSRVQELSIEIENGNEKINSNLADLVRKQKEFHLWVTADSTDSEKSLDRIEDIISTDLETDEMMKLFNRTSEVLELILKSHSGQSFKTSAGKTFFYYFEPLEIPRDPSKSSELQVQGSGPQLNVLRTNFGTVKCYEKLNHIYFKINSEDSPTINRISKAETFNGFDSNSSNKSVTYNQIVSSSIETIKKYGPLRSSMTQLFFTSGF